MTRLEQNVRWLDVAVDHSPVVRVRQGVGHFSRDPERLLNGKRSLSRQPILQRLSLHVRHHEVQESIRLAGVDQSEDARVGETGHDLDFAKESFVTHRSRQLRVQDLERHLPVVLQVHDQVHRGHATAANFPFNRVTVRQRTTQARE